MEHTRRKRRLRVCQGVHLLWKMAGKRAELHCRAQEGGPPLRVITVEGLRESNAEGKAALRCRLVRRP